MIHGIRVCGCEEVRGFGSCRSGQGLDVDVEWFDG
jgi:hypothetical protein